MARWESKFCQEEVRLSKTRHEARGTHEALAQRTTTNPHKEPAWDLAWGGRCARGRQKKKAGGGAGKGGTAKAKGGKEEAVGQQRQTLARADLECTRG